MRSVLDGFGPPVGNEAHPGLLVQEFIHDGFGMGQMAALTAQFQVTVGVGEVAGNPAVLAQVGQEAEGVGRELLAFDEVGPKGAVVFGDASGADDAEFMDELALDGVDFAAELGDGHGWRGSFADLSELCFCD